MLNVTFMLIFKLDTSICFSENAPESLSAFCTDGYSQDLENNPAEPIQADFTLYEIIMSTNLLNIKGYS